MALQGYLAHKKQTPPPGPYIGLSRALALSKSCDQDDAYHERAFQQDLLTKFLCSFNSCCPVIDPPPPFMLPSTPYTSHYKP